MKSKKKILDSHTYTHQHTHRIGDSILLHKTYKNILLVLEPISEESKQNQSYGSGNSISSGISQKKYINIV